MNLLDTGLTLQSVLRDIPTDGPAMIVYALVLAFVGFTWVGSRKRSAAALPAAGSSSGGTR